MTIPQEIFLGDCLLSRVAVNDRQHLAERSPASNFKRFADFGSASELAVIVDVIYSPAGVSVGTVITMEISSYSPISKVATIEVLYLLKDRIIYLSSWN